MRVTVKIEMVKTETSDNQLCPNDLLRHDLSTLVDMVVDGDLCIDREEFRRVPIGPVGFSKTIDISHGTLEGEQYEQD